MSKKKSKQKHKAPSQVEPAAPVESSDDKVHGYSKETIEVFEDEVAQRMASGYSYEDAAKFVGEQNEEPWRDIMIAIDELKRLENRTMA